MVKGPTTQISPLKMRSKNYIGFTSASEAGFTTSKATGTGKSYLKVENIFFSPYIDQNEVW